MSAFRGKIKNKSAARRNVRAYDHINQLIANQATGKDKIDLINKALENGIKSNKED